MNERLTNLFKSIIIKEDLIDTGALLKSVRVFVKINYSTVEINITSKFYVKYLKDRYDLVIQFINNPIFEEETGNLLYPLFEALVVNTLNGVPQSETFGPNVKVLINGR